jgi:hypothetical protein
LQRVIVRGVGLLFANGTISFADATALPWSQRQNQKQKIKRRIPCLCANCFTCRTKNASVVWVPHEGAPTFQKPCSEHEKLFKKAASARREHDELRRQLRKVVGTDQFEIVNQRARAVLEEAEAAMNEYLKHVREHER